MTITKKDFAEFISKETNLDYGTSAATVEKVIEYLKSNIIAGNRFEFRGLGSLQPVECKAKVGRDIRRGKSIIVSPMIKPKFKPSKDFVKLCNNK